jgi:hypothetical protein
MRRLRFSLLWLLGLIALIAVACAALRSASEIWGSATFSVMLAVLLFSLVGLIFRQRSARAFWGGFALIGWSYAALVFGPWCRDNVRDQLLTTKLLEFGHSKLLSAAPAFAVTSVTPTFVTNGWTAAGAGLPASTGAVSTITNADMDGDGVPDVSISGSTPAPVWTFSGTTIVPAAIPPRWYFMQVGHALLALLLASAGGLLARSLYEKRARPKQDADAGIKT